MDAQKLVSGIPKGLVGGLIGGVLGTLASTVGFLESAYFGLATGALFATIIFVSVWAEEATKEK